MLKLFSFFWFWKWQFSGGIMTMLCWSLFRNSWRTKRMQQLQTQKDVPLCQDTSSKFLSSTSRGEGETCATTRHARNYICLKWRWENMPCDERACESLIERPRSRLILQQQFYT